MRNDQPIAQKIYTKTDGRGNYPLTQGGHVMMTQDPDSEYISELDGEPHSKNSEYDLYSVNGKLGLYDGNLKLFKSFDDFDDFLYYYEETPYMHSKINFR